MPLLEIENLVVEFRNASLQRRIIDDVSLQLNAGSTLALVGESGSGKTITALSIAQLIANPEIRCTAGTIRLQNADVLKMSKKELQSIRGKQIGYIFQEPAVSLNPVMRIGNQILESLKLHQPEKASRDHVLHLMKTVGIPAPEQRIDDYPHHFSGGMLQRIMIAMALAPEPGLLIADEPTTALDVTIQAQILELLKETQKRRKMALLLITHNLGIVCQFEGHIAVMYAGQIVEKGAINDVIQSPMHPYTQLLIASIPKMDDSGGRLKSIPGMVPSFRNYPVSGCRFCSRCPLAKPSCSTEIPEFKILSNGRAIRCPWINP